MSRPKYPRARVKLIGQDGNAFMVLSQVRRALRDEGVDEEIIAEFQEEAMSGDYAHLLATVRKWVSVS